MIPTNIRRPRNVNVSRAAAILYGDWGTSKAYVIGLAFAVGRLCIVLADRGDVHTHCARRD